MALNGAGDNDWTFTFGTRMSFGRTMLHSFVALNRRVIRLGAAVFGYVVVSYIAFNQYSGASER